MKILSKQLLLKITFVLLFCLLMLFLVVNVLHPKPIRDTQTKRVVSSWLPLQELWRWSGEIGTSSDEPPKMLIQGKFILAYVNRRTLVCFDAHTGNIIWQQKFSNLDSIAVDDERVYVGGIEDVIAYRLMTGDVVWQKQLYEPSASSSLNFRIKAFEFSASIIKLKMPVDSALFVICVSSPYLNLSLKN